MAGRITLRKFLGYIILFAFIHYGIIPMIFAPPPPAKRQKIEHEPQQLNENVVEGDYPDVCFIF